MMWSRLMRLCAAARRPLVVVDFETCGLSAAPPVEFAVLAWAPWRAPEDDEVTERTARLVPPGLTYAFTQRLDPGRRIPADATRVHGIGDADVRGCPAWDDLEVRAYFRGLAVGDEDAGPAVWCGHNVAAADVPWMRRWGYLHDNDWRPITMEPAPEPPMDVIDTMRLHRRLAADHPQPLAPDALCEGGWRQHDMHSPCIGLGLDAFASSLTGSHAAITGSRVEGAHGALSDGVASARVLSRMLDGWSPLWPGAVVESAVPAGEQLAALLAALDAPPGDDVSWDGWLRRVPAASSPDLPGVPLAGARESYEWRRGKFAGRPAHRDAWVLGLPRAPTGDSALPGWCSLTTAAILESLGAARA